MNPLFRRHRGILFLTLIALILLLGNNSVSLWDQDEAAYAGFGQTMLESGNWLIPEFTWSDVHRKPPLHFWTVAASFAVFGVNTFALRFPSVLAILGTLALVYFAGRRLVDERKAFMALVVGSTTFLIPALAKVAVTDATLLFFTTLCGFAVLFVMRGASWRWVAVFWLSFALALLVKGPPVVIFAGILAAGLFVFHPRRKRLLRFHPWFFLPLAFLPLFIWGWMCYQSPEGKAFIDWMIDWYILRRIGSSVFGQTGPPGTHLLGILLFFIPWLMFFPRALAALFKSLFSKDKGVPFLLAGWFVAAWLIFEFSPSKLPAYVVAAHVPMMYFIAREVLQSASSKRPHPALVVVHYVFNLAIGLALMVGAFLLPELETLPRILIGLSGLLLTIGHLYTLLQKTPQGFIRSLMATNVMLQLLVWVVVLPAADNLKNASLRIARYIEAQMPPDTHVVIANKYSRPPSLPFYLYQRFGHVTEAYEAHELIALYEETPTLALILNQERLHALQAHIPGINHHEIRPVFTDRIAQASYYIVLKKP